MLPGERELHCHLWQGASRQAVRSKYLIESMLRYYGIGERAVAPSQRGKPGFRADALPQLAFSAANSLHLGLLVVGSGVQLGCDIERHKSRHFDKISRAYFHRNEARMIADAADASSTFYRLWTLKEAHCKALDQPLARSMSVDFSAALQDEPSPLDSSQARPGFSQQPNNDNRIAVVNMTLPVTGDVEFSSAIAVCSDETDWQLTLIEH